MKRGGILKATSSLIVSLLGLDPEKISVVGVRQEFGDGTIELKLAGDHESGLPIVPEGACYPWVTIDEIKAARE